MVEVIYNLSLPLTLLALIVPFAVYIITIKKWQGALPVFISVLVSLAIMSSLVVLQWIALDWALELAIEPLDRDNDGFWSPDEEATWTDADRRNIDLQVGDGGRNVFSVIVFPIFSVVYSILVIGACSLARFLFNMRVKNA